MVHKQPESGSQTGDGLENGPCDTTATTMTKNSIDEKYSTSGAPRPLDDANSLEKTKTAGELPSDELEKQITQFSIHHPKAYPDGGLTAWLCVVGGFFATFSSFGFLNCIGLFQVYYEQHQLSAYTPSTISWISSLQTCCMFIFGPITGKVFDTYGPTYVIAIGTILEVFGLMMVSICKEYWHFVLAQGIVTGLGAGFIFTPTMACVMTWFFKRRALACGLVVAGSSIGGVIFPIMFTHLVGSVGFGWAIRAIAFLVLGVMVISILTTKSRLPPKGATSWHYSIFINGFKEPPYALTVAGAFFYFFAMFIPMNFLPAFSLHHGMSEEMSNNLVAILSGASLIGRILPAFLADKLGRYNVITVISIFSGVLVLAVWLPTKGNVAEIIFAVFYGIAMGGFVSVAPSLIGQISDVREIGIRTGLMFSCLAIAALIGNPIGGALVTQYNGEYKGLQIFSGVIIVASAFFFIGTRWCLVGNKLVKKV